MGGRNPAWALQSPGTFYYRKASMQPGGGEQEALERISQMEALIRERLGSAHKKAKEITVEAAEWAATHVAEKEAELERLERSFDALVKEGMGEPEKEKISRAQISPIVIKPFAEELFKMLTGKGGA